MGAASAEGLRPALIGVDVEDARENEPIRDKNGDARHKDIDAHNNENLQFIDVGAGAGELHHR